MHLEGMAIPLWAVIMEQVLERYTISAVIYPKFDELMSVILTSVFVFVLLQLRGGSYNTSAYGGRAGSGYGLPGSGTGSYY